MTSDCCLARSLFDSRSSYTDAPVSVNSSASVVLPTCRGPNNATAGDSSSAATRAGTRRRRIILAIMERSSRNTRMSRPGAVRIAARLNRGNGRNRAAGHDNEPPHEGRLLYPVIDEAFAFDYRIGAVPFSGEVHRPGAAVNSGCTMTCRRCPSGSRSKAKWSDQPFCSNSLNREAVTLMGPANSAVLAWGGELGNLPQDVPHPGRKSLSLLTNDGRGRTRTYDLTDVNRAL